MLWVLIAFLTGCSCQIHILKGTLMGPHRLAHQIAKPVIGDVPTVNIENAYDESNERPPRDLRQYEYDPQHDVNDRAAKDRPNLTSNLGDKFKPLLNNAANLQGKLTDRIKEVPKLKFDWVPPKNTAKADPLTNENVTHISIGAADLDDDAAPSNDEPKLGLKKLKKKIKKKKIVKNALKDKPKYVLFYDKQYVTPDGRVIQIASNIPGRARNAEKPRRSDGPLLMKPLLMTDTDNESINEDEPKVGLGLIGYKLDKKIKKGAKKLLKKTVKGLIKMPVYTNVITFRDSAANRGMWRIADPEKPQRRYVAVPQDPIIDYLNNPKGNLEQPSDNDLARAETDTNIPQQSETGNYTDDETNINNLNYMRSQLLQYLMKYIRTTFTDEASQRNNSVTPLDARLTNYYDNSVRNDNDGDNDTTSVTDDENDDDNNKNGDNEHDENENDENENDENENVENEHDADADDDHASDANEDKENEQQPTQQQTQSDRNASPYNDNEKCGCATDSSNMGNNVVIVDLKKKSNLNAGESLTSAGSCGECGTEKKKYVNAHREVKSTIISVGKVNNAKPNHCSDCLQEAKESENLNKNHSSKKVSLHFDLNLSSK